MGSRVPVVLRRWTDWGRPCFQKPVPEEMELLHLHISGAGHTGMEAILPQTKHWWRYTVLWELLQQRSNWNLAVWQRVPQRELGKKSTLYIFLCSHAVKTKGMKVNGMWLLWVSQVSCFPPCPLWSKRHGGTCGFHNITQTCYPLFQSLLDSPRIKNLE